MADELITPADIAEAALGAAEFEADGQRAKSHKLSDLLDARDRLNEETAAANKSRGLRFTKLVPPGATS